jgi:hypothetical protein
VAAGTVEFGFGFFFQVGEPALQILDLGDGHGLGETPK